MGLPLDLRRRAPLRTLAAAERPRPHDRVTARARVVTVGVACALHLALLAPTVGGWSSVLELDFAPEAEAIESGERPYRDQALEYPPLSIPVIVGPALISEGTEDYMRAFQWQMIGFDLAIVVLLGFGVRGGRERVLGGLAVYTIGVVALSGIVLGDSVIDVAPLALSRFELVPAFLVLAAALARERGRSATWSALLSTGTAVKAFPLLLYPALLRGERNLVRVALATAVPVLVAATLVISWGDDFGSAISYHTGRAMQVEAVAATPFGIARLLGAGVDTEFGSGSFNVVSSGAAAARALSISILVCAYTLVLWSGWRARTDPARLAVALLAVTIAFSPVLSPQFVFWLLPLSAAVYGLGRENVLLLAAVVLTQLALQYYDQVIYDLRSDFVWRLAARNVALLGYAYLACAPIVRAGSIWRRPGAERLHAPEAERAA